MKVIERRVYRGTPEHALYLSARFGGGRVPSHLSFEFDGHRWAYRYSSFCDKGEYDLIWRPDEDADGKPADGVLPPMPEPEDYCGDHNLGVEMFSREQMQAYALAALERFGAGGGEPMFWYRPCSNGMYEGPIHDAQIESVRRESGAWKPLFPHPSPTDLRAERELRRMLCIMYAGGHAYMDDGEAQDNRANPPIDFMRDSPEVIQQKIQQRSLYASPEKGKQ